MAISKAQGATAAMAVGGVGLAGGFVGVVGSIFSNQLPMLKNLGQAGRTALSYGSATLVTGGAIVFGAGLIFKQSVVAPEEPPSSSTESTAEESTAEKGSSTSESVTGEGSTEETISKENPLKKSVSEQTTSEEDFSQNGANDKSASGKKPPITEEPAKPEGKALRTDTFGDVDARCLSMDHQQRFFCVLTQGVPRDPAILGQEGNGYSEDMIRKHFHSVKAKTEHKTPVTGVDVRDVGPVIIPNRALRDFIEKGEELKDPISGEGFNLAWICVKTGYTYNIGALREHFDELRASGKPFTCPKSGLVLREIFLYPNYPLWDLAGEELPKPDPEPVRLSCGADA